MKKIYVWYDSDFDPRQILASSVKDARRQLLRQNRDPIKIKSMSLFANYRFSSADLLVVSKQLSTMLKAGLPLVESLQLLAQQHPKAHWQCLLNDIQHQLIDGHILSEVIERYDFAFPALYSQIIAIGELTGQLDHSFLQLGKQIENSLNLQKRIKKAMRYPIFLLATTLCVSLVMLLFVFPQFASVYQSFDAALPHFTQFFIWLSYWLTNQFMTCLVSCLIIIGCYKGYFKPRYRHQFDRVLTKIPVLGKVIQSHFLAQLFQTLAITEQAGIPLLAGLRAAIKTTSNQHYQQCIKQIKIRIEQGQSFSDSLNYEKVFPTLCFQLIRVGEESGTLDLMLDNLAVYYLEQNTELTDNLSAKVEPILMLVLSVIVGSLIMAMYLPIFQLGDMIH